MFWHYFFAFTTTVLWIAFLGLYLTYHAKCKEFEWWKKNAQEWKADCTAARNELDDAKDKLETIMETLR